MPRCLSLLAAGLVACGSGTEAPDAGPPDAADIIDAPPILDDAGNPATHARVRVVRAGVARPGAKIIVQSPAGLVLETVDADGSGEAMVALPAGGMVTAVTTDPVGDGTTDHRLYTVIGAAPGDNLYLEMGAAALPTGTAMGQVTVNFPRLPDQTGVDAYAVTLGAAPVSCTATASQPAAGVDTVSVLVNLSSACIGLDGRASVLVTATDGGVLLASTQRTGVIAVSGGTVEVTAAWSAAGTVLLGLTGVPSGMNAGGPLFGQHRMGPAYLLATHSTTLVAGAASTALRVPVGFSDVWRRLATFSGTPAGSTVSQLGIIQDLFAPAPASDFDFATQMFPVFMTVSDPTAVQQPSANSRRVSWTSAAAVSGEDAWVLALTWSSGGPHRWLLVAPPGSTQITTPALPAALAASGPDNTAVTRDFVYVVDRGETAGYPALRSRLDLVTRSHRVADLLSLFPSQAPGLSRWLIVGSPFE